MTKPNFGTALTHKERMPQTFSNKDPAPHLPFYDEQNTVHFNWKEYLTVLFLLGCFLLGVFL